MSKADLEEGFIKVRQQETGKELWIPLHASLKCGPGTSRRRGPLCRTPRASPTPPMVQGGNAFDAVNVGGADSAGGYTFHGIRASSVVSLREVGCTDRDIESITGISPAMVTRHSRFADQRRVAKAAIHRLERNRS